MNEIEIGTFLRITKGENAGRTAFVVAVNGRKLTVRTGSSEFVVSRTEVSVVEVD